MIVTKHQWLLYIWWHIIYVMLIARFFAEHSLCEIYTDLELWEISFRMTFSCKLNTVMIRATTGLFFCINYSHEHLCFCMFINCNRSCFWVLSQNEGRVLEHVCWVILLVSSIKGILLNIMSTYFFLNCSCAGVKRSCVYLIQHFPYPRHLISCFPWFLWHILWNRQGSFIWNKI